jgi:hypothetical protein
MSYDHKTDWYYEGNISRIIVNYLTEQGFTILKDNSDNIKARGIDIITKDSISYMIMEVKGYPTEFHTKGNKKGEPKVTKPELQAKHWFNEVIMTTLLNYNKFRHEPNLKLAIGLPKFEIYSNLVKKIQYFFSDNKLEFKVYFVDVNSKVEEYDLTFNA